MKRDLSVHFPRVKRGILKNHLNKQPRLEKSLKCSKNEVEVKVLVDEKFARSQNFE